MSEPHRLTLHLSPADVALLHRLCRLLNIDERAAVILGLRTLERSAPVQRLRQRIWHERPGEGE
jgi:hypothetical protein